jgi:CheY-like chemotaxis protein
MSSENCMKDIADWLIEIERKAQNLYSSSARALKNDKAFSDFLEHLAEEEAWHEVILGKAVAHLAECNHPAAISLDRTTREKVEEPFRDCGRRLKAGSLTMEHIIHCIVAAEFSEWNDIFVYVVNAVKDAGLEFANAASKLQAHRRLIEKYIASLPNGHAYLSTLRRLPAIWDARILIAEDHEGVLEFLSSVLSREGTVESAKNGKEGLDKARATFYDVVISEVNLPVMDGREFFQALAHHDPRIGERFLFLTKEPRDENITFFRKYNVKYLTKPMRIREIEETVEGILTMIPNKEKAN